MTSKPVKGISIKGQKVVQKKTYVAGQSRKVLEARAAKQEAAWRKQSKSKG